MKKVKRRLRPSIKYTLYIIALGLLVFNGMKLGGELFNGGQKSVNENAKKVKINNCIAYYPQERGNEGKKFAENVCNNAKVQDEQLIFDYTVTNLNDYIKIDYGQGDSYLVDKQYNDPKLGELSEKGQMIISDYLRYTLKSNGLDYGYTTHFLEESYYTNISLEQVDDYHFDGDNLYLQFDIYDAEAKIPLKYIASEVGLDLGLDNSHYVKPTYVDPNRKAIALTFDDGPSLEDDCTNKLLDELYKYDAVGTFYVVGSRLYDQTEAIIGKGIELGNEYGSHSCTHAKLTKLTKEEAYAEIMDVDTWFKENFNYKINSYRPPFGSYNSAIDEIIPLAAVLWDIDSVDWQLRNADAIIEEIGDDLPNNAVILMHDIHATSVEAAVDKGLIKKLIEDGYQLVSVSDIAKLRNVKLEQGVHLCWDH